MPRSVPCLPVSEVLICTKRLRSPCRANSSSQKNRAKKPRSSPRFSRSIANAPARGRVVNFTALRYPAQVGAEAALRDVALEHLQAHELRRAEVLVAELHGRQPLLQLANRLGQRHLRLMARREALVQRKVDAVGALVRRRRLVDRDLGAGN